jgi:hypothetical protein
MLQRSLRPIADALRHASQAASGQLMAFHLEREYHDPAFVRALLNRRATPEHEGNMSAKRNSRLLAKFTAVGAVVATCVTNGWAAEQAAQSSIPDFSGVWLHPFWPGFDPPLSGSGPVVNKLRLPNGSGNWRVLVGDYTNPILKPNAAEIVRKWGDISLTGVVPPTPANQCWPQPVPYIFWNLGMQMLQQRDQIVMLYDKDHEFRRIRMNQAQPPRVVPSWHGDSVGHYEGETLVIDTVGVKVDRPFAMADVYGTPYTRDLHVVERYRLIDFQATKEAEVRSRGENLFVFFNDSGLTPDPDYRGKGLQLEFIVEDEGVFTMPWSATVTYQHAVGVWPENVCAENVRRTGAHGDEDTAVPVAAKLDF